MLRSTTEPQRQLPKLGYILTRLVGLKLLARPRRYGRTLWFRWGRQCFSATEQIGGVPSANILVGGLDEVFIRTVICVTLCSLPTRAFQSKSNRAISPPQKPLGIQVPIGIGESLWRKRIPRNNPLSTGKVALGRALYFDKRLSINGTLSCATCHDPANTFTDHNVVALGAFGRAGTRNAPTILNAMFSERLFWDGRAGSLEEQAKQPLTNEFEMGMGSYDAVVERLIAIPQYRRSFRLAFKNEGI